MILKKQIARVITCGLRLCLLLPVSAFAHVISITASTPFPATVLPSSTNTALYTIQNTTSNAILSIVDKSQFPSSLSILNSTCGNPLEPGQSCQILLRLIAPSTPQTISTFLKEGALPSADGVQAPINVIVSGSQLPITPVAAAVGRDFGNSVALITASTDGGNTWSVKNIQNNIDAELNLTSCLSNGTSDFCITVGSNNTTNAPFIVASIDGGNTWGVADTSSLPLASFNGTSCTGSGPSAICIAVGSNDNTGVPLITQSFNMGTTWNAVNNVTNDQGTFAGASCFGSGSTATCIATGEDSNTSTPLLAITTNGGSTWSTASITGLTSGVLEQASCTGSSSSAICAVVADDFTTGTSVIVVSTDGGNTWNNKNISGLPNTPNFTSISCTGTGSTAVCVAAGQHTAIGLNEFLLAVSTDGANTWNAVTTIPGFTDGASLNAVSCTGTGTTAICVAAGQDESTSSPLSIISTDGGNTWNIGPSLINSGQFNAVSCSGLYCIAVGSNNNFGGIMQSVDGTQTWSVVNIANIPTGSNLFGSAAVGATATLQTSLSSALSNTFPRKIITPKESLRNLVKEIR